MLKYLDLIAPGTSRGSGIKGSKGDLKLVPHYAEVEKFRPACRILSVHIVYFINGLFLTLFSFSFLSNQSEIYCIHNIRNACLVQVGWLIKRL